MKFFFYVPGMRTDGYAIENLSLGGSETAGIQMARELVRKGHRSVVFSNTPEPSNWQGVQFLPIGERQQMTPLGQLFENAAVSEPHDALIVQRVPMPFHRMFASKVNFLSMHDLARVRNRPAFKATAWNCQGVISVSDWHGDQIAKAYDLPREFVHTVRNGVDLDLFTKEPNYERKFRSKKIVYLSRPERGLVNLVGPDGIMERLQKIDPAITLVICGYDNTTPEMEGHYQELAKRAHDLPNVEIVGALSKKVLAELLRDAALLVYPTVPKKDHEETSCIAVMEAQCAGTPIIAMDNGAIVETMGKESVIERGLLYDYEKNGSCPIELIAGSIADSLRSSNIEWWIKSAEAAREYGLKTYGWDEPALALERLVFATPRKAGYESRLAKHFAYYSDLFALKNVYKQMYPRVPWPEIPDVETYLDKAEVNMSPEYYRNRPLDIGEKDVTVQQIFLSNAHYRSIFQLLEGELLKGPAKILEVACGTGRFLIGMAEAYPESTFVGEDISIEAVKSANALVKEMGLKNISFDTEDGLTMNNADILIVAEMLEHIENPGETIDDLEERIIPGGRVIATFPTGAIESTRLDNKPNDPIEHVHHFEPMDVDELWKGKEQFQRSYFSWGESAPDGSPVGGQLVSWIKGEAKSGAINYVRKLHEQNPRELLTVGMIVKWDEPSFRRVLRSIYKIADRIIVGVDYTGANDPSIIAQAEQAVEFFPLKNCPLEAGFDEARNEVLEKAGTEGWFLWIDADEELVYPERILKYLKPNCFEGYAVAHHHYSAEPAMILKTDYPTRIFRLDAGMKFFGVVHEHPAKSANEPPKHVMLIHENVSIAHTGYTNDAIRYSRFERNWPLMEREQKKHPHRLLGKYLMVRDLAHVNRWELQRNRGGITQEIRDRSEQVIDLCRELVKAKEVRLMVESLPYLTETVFAYTNGSGVKIKFSFDVDVPGIGRSPLFDDGDMMAAFMSTDDALAFTTLLTEEKLKFFKEEYM